MNNDQTLIQDQLNQKTEKERREERQRKQNSTCRDGNDSLTNKGLNYFDTQREQENPKQGKDKEKTQLSTQTKRSKCP